MNLLKENKLVAAIIVAVLAGLAAFYAAFYGTEAAVTPATETAPAVVAPVEAPAAPAATETPAAPEAPVASGETTVVPVQPSEEPAAH